MSTELILPKAVTNDAAVLSKHADRLMPLIPPGVDPQQFLSCCVVAANEISKPCEPKSILKAASNCARIGLMPGSALGLAYFVPFNNKVKGQDGKETKVTECTLVIGYRGFTDLAFGNRFLSSVHSEVILNGEEFEHWVDETGPRVKHIVPISRVVSKQNIVGAYTVYQTCSGGRGVVVMNRQQIDSVIPKYGADVWNYRFPEMSMKSTMRRSAKFWKLTPQMAMAVTLDEEAERGDSQTQMSDMQIIDVEPEQKPFSLSELADQPEGE